MAEEATEARWVRLDSLAVTKEIDLAARERDEHDFMLCVTEYISSLAGFTGGVLTDFEAFGAILPSRRAAYLGKMVNMRKSVRLVNRTGYERISGIGTMKLLDGQAMARQHFWNMANHMRWQARAMQWGVAQDEHWASVRDPQAAECEGRASSNNSGGV